MTEEYLHILSLYSELNPCLVDVVYCKNITGCHNLHSITQCDTDGMWETDCYHPVFTATEVEL